MFLISSGIKQAVQQQQASLTETRIGICYAS